MAYPDHHRGVWHAGTPQQPNGYLESASRALTDAEAAILLAEYQNDPAGRGYAGKNAAEICDLVNGTYLITNPTPAPQVPQPMTALGLMGLLSADELSAVDPFLPGENGVLAFLSAHDRGGVGAWVANMHACGKISDATYAALGAYLAATISDPTWPAQVVSASRSSLLFTDPPLTLEPADVTAATGVA